MNTGFEVKQYEYGWYIIFYEVISPEVKSLCSNDFLMARFFNIPVEAYREQLKSYGASGPDNYITHFASKEEAEQAIPFIEDLYNASVVMQKLSRV